MQALSNFTQVCVSFKTHVIPSAERAGCNPFNHNYSEHVTVRPTPLPTWCRGGGLFTLCSDVSGPICPHPGILQPPLLPCRSIGILAFISTSTSGRPVQHFREASQATAAQLLIPPFSNVSLLACSEWMDETPTWQLKVPSFIEQTRTKPDHSVEANAALHSCWPCAQGPAFLEQS